MLRVPKVLVLDEATASVDPETDAFLTEMIARIFTKVTTITIAHRLQTIMQADQIIVMDAGVVAEKGTYPIHGVALTLVWLLILTLAVASALTVSIALARILDPE